MRKLIALLLALSLSGCADASFFEEQAKSVINSSYERFESVG